MTSSNLAEPDHGWSLIGNRNFLLLWCAYGVSAIGDHLSEMAILKTQGALCPDVDVTPLNARMAFVFFVPFFLLGPITGVLADRFPRRGLMILADLVRMLIMFGFAWLVARTQGWGTWGPFLPLLLVGVFAAIFSPARSALLPSLIRRNQLVRANGMIAGLGVIATMAAGLGGGYLAAHYHPTVAFRWDAATFLASAVFLAFLKVPRRSHAVSGAARAGGSIHEIIEGFRYVRSHRRVVELLLVGALVWFCGSMVNSVIPAVVRDVYGGGYQAMSGYRAFLGLGFIIGAIIISILGNALRSEIAITWGAFGISVAVAGFAASVFLPLPPGALFWLGAVAVVGAGVFGIAVMASFNALLQRIVPDRFRGRVFGVKDLCCTGALLTATGLIGVPGWTHVDRWVGYILIAVAVAMFAAGAVTLLVRLHRSELGTHLTLAENLNEFLAKFWWRLQRVGASTVPRDGPVIIASNHKCGADPSLISAAVTYRPISFMVASEYVNWPVLGRVMQLLECIPVRRGTRDTGSTKQALRHLKEGKALGIFIEGGIFPPGQPRQPMDGVAMLALKTGAPVIPAHISGITYHKNLVRGIRFRHRARVRFGPRVDLSEFASGKPNRAAVRAATQKIFVAINDLTPDTETPATMCGPLGPGARTDMTHESA